MRLAALAYALLYDPDDECCGGWSQEQLVEMDGRFVAALERAFQSGQEHRESAANQVFPRIRLLRGAAVYGYAGWRISGRAAYMICRALAVSVPSALAAR